MHLQTASTSTSNIDRAIGFTLAAFSMFVVGYTATRTYLNHSQNPATTQTNSDFVIPHQAAMWSDIGN